MLRYKLRTLLIVLGIFPPVLALTLGPLLNYLASDPVRRQTAWVVSAYFLGFSAVWLVCGLAWLVIMRIFERLIGERQRS